MDTPEGFKKYWAYFKERFPLPGVLLYAGSVYYAAYFFAGLFPGSVQVNYHRSAVGFLIYVLSFLHLRIFDEHKDYSKDVLAYPDRMLSRGQITLRDLRALLYPVLILEGILSLLLGWMTFVCWLGILLWTLLMLKEFFVPDFLNRHMGLYLISHQLLVPLMILLPLSQRLEFSNLSDEGMLSLSLFSLGSMFLTVTYEIARKTWSSDRDHEQADSYSRIWGRTAAVVVNLMTALSGGMLYLIIYRYAGIPSLYGFIAGGFFLLFVISCLLFLLKPVRKVSQLLEGAGAAYMLALFILSAVAFALHPVI